MRNIFTVLTSLLILNYVHSQSNFQRAYLDDSGQLNVEIVEMNHFPNENFIDVDSEPFLSFGGPAFTISKNTRGLTLADLDGDGTQEAVFAINATLYAMKGDGTILFEKTFTGPILLPPTIADLNDDEMLEIVVNYGYPTTVGGVGLLDNEGNDLPGWPVSYDGHWMINAPAVADLDGDGMMEIVTGERVSGTVGYVHALKLDGTELNENWPVQIGATPAFTPSIGDVNNDGSMDIVIAGSSSGMYIFNTDGTAHPGFPVYDANISYSYQSPILVDLDGDDNLEIVGANHGNAAAFYAMKADGTYMDGWPYALGGWTYSPVTVADVDDDEVYEIFGGNPNFSEGTPLPTIYGTSPDGEDLDNFPIEKIGGNEGVISIADINNDGVLELVFGSNIIDGEGNGYIHAYSLNGSGEIEGFPLRPKGFTFLNGAVLGDIDGDGMMDLTANSYTLNFGTDVDSVFINSYNLNVPYDPEKIIRNGYKGSNTRDGLILPEENMSIDEMTNTAIQIYPNPSTGILNVNLEKPTNQFSISIFDLTGRNIFTKNKNINSNQIQYNLESLPKGIYVIQIIADKQKSVFKWSKK